MVVKAETATVQLPELEFEIPAQRGQITTVESVIQQAISNLELDQPHRLVCSSNQLPPPLSRPFSLISHSLTIISLQATDPEIGKRVGVVIGKLGDCLKVKQPFTVVRV